MKQHTFSQKILKLIQIVQQTFHEFIHLVQYYLIHSYNYPNILEDYSRPPTPNPQEDPFRVNSKIIRSLYEDPRYTILPDRFINKSSLSNPRKQRELRRLQEDPLILKFEVEVTFNSLKPHPFSLSTRVAHKTTSSLFLVTSISYLCDAELPEIRTGRINFLNPFSGINYRTKF